VGVQPDQSGTPAGLFRPHDLAISAPERQPSPAWRRHPRDASLSCSRAPLQTASGAAPAAAACRAFIVPLSSTALGDEAAFLSEAVAAAAGAQGRYIGVLAAQAAGRPRARRLQASPTATATPSPIYMLPEITTGLLVGLMMLGFTGVGLSCVMGIRTPEVMHSTVLPAGKEY
jgi:hypothetical protein